MTPFLSGTIWVLAPADSISCSQPAMSSQASQSPWLERAAVVVMPWPLHVPAAAAAHPGGRGDARGHLRLARARAHLRLALGRGHVRLARGGAHLRALRGRDDRRGLGRLGRRSTCRRGLVTRSRERGATGHQDGERGQNESSLLHVAPPEHGTAPRGARRAWTGNRYESII